MFKIKKKRTMEEIQNEVRDLYMKVGIAYMTKAAAEIDLGKYMKRSEELGQELLARVKADSLKKQQEQKVAESKEPAKNE